MNQNGFTRIPRPNAHCVEQTSSIGHGREAARKAAIWRVCGAVWRREPYNLTLESKTYYTQNYDTKTTSGDRMVYLSKEMCQLLKTWRKECEWDRQQTANEAVSEDDYLFRQPNGKPMNPCTFTCRFKLILKANNLPLDLNVHSLRHANASLLISQGVDVRTVASLLGHAQASTTLDIYAHAFDKNKRKAQKNLERRLDYEKNQIDPCEQKYPAESACTLLLQ